MNKNEVGKRIKEIRVNLGLSMTKFGSKIDEIKPVKSGVISNWENGKQLPNKERMRKIAELGDITLNELLYGFSITHEEIKNNLNTLEMKQNFKNKIYDFIDNYMAYDNPSNLLNKTIDLLEILLKYEANNLDELVEKIHTLVTSNISAFIEDVHLLLNEDFEKLPIKLYLTEFVYITFVQLSLNYPDSYLENLLLQLKETKRNIRNISIKLEYLNNRNYSNKLANFINTDEYMNLFHYLNDIEDKIKERKIIDE